MADTTNSGAMMELYQSRPICRPRIHAVTEWTRMATGSAMQLATHCLWAAPSFLETRNTSSTMFMMM